MIKMPKHTFQKEPISESDLKKLIETREPHCISLYIPTHVTGEEVLQQKDAKTLGTEIRKIRKALESISWTPEAIENLLAPILELASDGEYWRHQSEGLALFRSANWFRAFRVPVSFDAMHYIGDRFYLVPLVPELRKPNHFYLLSLELERVRMFKGSEFEISELNLGDLIPQQKEERVGYDYEQKGLQFRSQHQAHGPAGFHGHAEADRDRKDEIQRFFREVDRGLQTILKKDPGPLVIASQEYLAALYRDVSSIEDTAAETLVVNLSEATLPELQEGALEKLRPLRESVHENKWAAFSEMHGTDKASTQMDKILIAGLEGRIDTLFIGRGAELWGTFDDQSLEVLPADKSIQGSGSLLNGAVQLTLLHGGQVYERDLADMPGGDVIAAALFRY